MKKSFVFLASLLFLIPSQVRAQIVCDGVTDYTVAIQSSLDDIASTPNHTGTLVLPAGRCIITDSLVVGHYQTEYNHINIVGQGSDSTSIIYQGPKDRPAIISNHNSYFTWHDFSIANSGDHGTSIGLLVTATAGEGTQSTTGLFNKIAISNFNIDWWFGYNGASFPGEASEMTLQDCAASNADVGWMSSGYNSLNFWLYNFQAGFNDKAIYVGNNYAGDGPKIIGAAFTHNTHDIFGQNTFGYTVVENVRSESPEFIGGQFSSLVVKNSSGSAVNLVNVQNTLLEMVALSGLLNIHGAYGFISIIHSTIATANPPMLLTFTPGSDDDLLFVNTKSNFWRNPANVNDVHVIPDYQIYTSKPLR